MRKIQSKDFQIPNKFSTECEICGDSVPEGDGLSSKTTSGSWFTVCATRQCILAAGLDVPGEESRELRRDATDDGRLVIDTPYEPDNLPKIKALTGRQFDGDRKVWTVPADPSVRAEILELADRIDLDVEPGLHDFDNGDAIDIDAVVDQAAQLGAYDYQLEGIRFLAARTHALLADDMGLGKTMQALLGLPKSAAVLVACPNSVKFVWAAEIEKWRSSFDVYVPDSAKEVRPPTEGEIVIINYAKLPGRLDDDWSKDDYDSNGVDLDDEWTDIDAVIADEAHAFKNREAHRTRRFRELADLADRVWLLTGTPLPNRPFDLKGTLESGGLFWEAFGTWDHFLDVFRGHKGPYGGYEFGTPKPEAKNCLDAVMVRRHKDDVLDELPAKTRQTITINGLAEDLGDRLDDLAVEFGEDLDEGRLPPFCEFSEVRRDLAEARIEAAQELVDEYEGAERPLVVFSAHRAPVEAIGARDGWGLITGGTPDGDRAEIIRRFQNGELNGIAGTIGACKEGITLTRADTILFVDRAWTPGDNQQAEDRIRRIGQDSDKCHYVVLTSDHPLDQHVQDLLDWKQSMIATAVDGKGVERTTAPTFDVDEIDDEVWERKVRERLVEYEEEQDAPEPVEHRGIEPERRRRVVEALDYLLARCDGARTKDDVGFNKYDARAAREIRGRLETDNAAVRYAEDLLRKYYETQLEGRFPELY